MPLWSSFVKSLQRLIINWPSLQNPQNHSARYNLGRRIPFAFPVFFSSINLPNLLNPQNHSAIYYFGRRLASQPRKPQCTLFMAQATSFLKVSKSRKQFLEFSILPKNEGKRDKTILRAFRILFLVFCLFFGKIENSNSNFFFMTYWPLVETNTKSYKKQKLH